jgi:hypothetical protein
VSRLRPLISDSVVLVVSQTTFRIPSCDSHASAVSADSHLPSVHPVDRRGGLFYRCR